MIKYRYRLERRALGGEGTVLFVMLNPSTADDQTDDPTIRRCVGFARSWGYERLLVGNLFAMRATNPRDLRYDPSDAYAPAGVENDDHLRAMAEEADLIVCAWGALSTRMMIGQQNWVVYCVLDDHGFRALGVTKHHFPRHPLYVPASARPRIWRAWRAAGSHK